MCESCEPICGVAVRMVSVVSCVCMFFFQAEDGIRDVAVTGVQTCALPISFRVPGGPARGRDRGDRDCSRIKTSDRSPRGSGRRHASASQSTRDPAFSRKADYGALGLMESAFRQSLFFSTFQEEAKIECCRQRCLCRSSKRSLVVPVGPAGYDQRFSFTPMDAGSRRYLRLAAKRSYRARRAWATAGGHSLLSDFGHARETHRNAAFFRLLRSAGE